MTENIDTKHLLPDEAAWLANTPPNRAVYSLADDGVWIDTSIIHQLLARLAEARAIIDDYVRTTRMHDLVHANQPAAPTYTDWQAAFSATEAALFGYADRGQE